MRTHVLLFFILLAFTIVSYLLISQVFPATGHKTPNIQMNFYHKIKHTERQITTITNDSSAATDFTIQNFYSSSLNENLNENELSKNIAKIRELNKTVPIHNSFVYNGLQVVNPPLFGCVTDPSNGSKSESAEKPSLLVGILASPSSREARSIIRKTWAAEAALRGLRWYFRF